MLFRASTVLVLATSALTAQLPAPAPLPEPVLDTRSWFAFTTPARGDQQTAGSPIDLSFLNGKARAGADGRLRTDGERLVNSKGEEVRIFGVNVCDFHTLPTADVARTTARRLAQLGVNGVRIHYADWERFGKGGLLGEDFETPDPRALLRLDRLIAELADHGIYINLNLHVARGYENMPEGWDWMGKAIDRIHRPYLESQKRYAAALLGHVNTVTGLRYANDPAIAFVELNNENTVFNELPGRWAALPERFTQPLRADWIAWLRKRVRDDNALVARWESTKPGAELLTPEPAAWSLQDYKHARIVTTASELGFVWDAFSAGPAWHSLQMFQQDIQLAKGTACTFLIAGTAEQPTEVTVGFMCQSEPWNNVSEPVKITLGPEPSVQSFVLSIADTLDRPIRFYLNLENNPAKISLTRLSLKPGEGPALLPGESLAEGSVGLPAVNTNTARWRDWNRFLAEREIAHSLELRNYVRDELRCSAILSDSQAAWGYQAGLYRENAVSDIIDVHACPAHGSGKPGAWRQYDDSLLGRAGDWLACQAFWRVAGKPFMMSEYDMQPPNRYRNEMLPFVVTLGGLQRWNALFEYTWLNFQGDSDYDPREVVRQHIYHTTGDSVQIAQFPTAALAFRLGLVPPLPGPDARLVLSEDDALSPYDTWPHRHAPRLWLEKGWNMSEAFTTRLSVTLKDQGSSRIEGDQPPARKIFPSAHVVFDKSSPDRERLLVRAPAARFAIGRIVGDTIPLGDVMVNVTRAGFGGHAAITLVALDGLPVAESQKLLLTVLAQGEDTGLVREPDGSIRELGLPPHLLEPVSARVTLPGSGWRAQALDERGWPAAEVPFHDGAVSTEGIRSPWILITR
jgi:hypothetical protein